MFFIFFTIPGTAVQLHPHAHGGGHLGGGDQADVAGDDRRVKVFKDVVVGVTVGVHRLENESRTGGYIFIYIYTCIYTLKCSQYIHIYNLSI